MRDGRLANGKVLDDIADADRVAAGGEEIEDANARGIGEGLEPPREFAGARGDELGRGGASATGDAVFRGLLFAGHNADTPWLHLQERTSIHRRLSMNIREGAGGTNQRIGGHA